MKKLIKKLFRSKLNLTFGSRFTSFLFIATSMMVAAGILFGANIYYNIDTGEVVVQEIQRVTNVIRATAGLIVGGADGQNPAAGHRLEVVGSTLFSGTAMVGNVANVAQELRFLEGGGGAAQHVGFRAPSGLTTDRIYILPHHDTHEPADNMVLTWKTDNELRWQSLAGVGAGGDITAVGSMLTGDAFAGPTANNQWLGLGAAAGRIAFDDQVTTDFVNILNANVGIGTATPAQRLSVAGTFGILEGGASPTHYTIFQGGDQLGNVTYTLPANAGVPWNVLTTDGQGVLSWQSVSGVGGVAGAGTVNRLARWTGVNTIGDGSIVDNLATGTALTIDGTGNVTIANNLTVSGTGIHAFGGTLDPHFVAGFTLSGPIAGSGAPNITGIGQFSGATAVLSGSVTAPLFTGTGPVTIQSGPGGELILDSATGVIRLAAADHIQTSGGHPIRASGEQILREVIPIFGFDLPARTASTAFVTVSRTLEDYPFSSAMAGTTRIHKLIIRYADTLDPAAIDPAHRVSNWQVWNITTGAQAAVFNVPATPGTDDAGLARGEVEITGNIAIPMGGADWRIDVRLPTTGRKIQIYQIFLAAYDQVN